MYQRHPSYPSQDRYNPLYYHMKDEGKEIQFHSNRQDQHFSNHRRDDLKTKIFSDQKIHEEQSKLSHSQEGYEQILGNALYDQTCANIQNMILSNTLTIQKLQRNNEQFRQHLHNLKKIFIKMPSPRHSLHQIAYDLNSEKNQSYLQQSFRQNFDQREFLPSKSEENVNNNQRICSKWQNNSITKQWQNNSIAKLEKDNPQKHVSENRRLYLQSKGPVRYTKQQWVKEQRWVQDFIKSCIQNYIQVTPHEPFNVVPKSKILNMYLNWRRMKKVDSELKENRIQTVITNQMKVIFQCTCTLRDYIGMVLNLPEKLHENGDIKRLKSPSDEIHLKKQDIFVSRSQIEVQSIKEEIIDEQFSFGQEEGEIVVDKNRQSYL